MSSVTPGNFETPMGALEKDEAGTYLKFNAIKRNGRPEEIAALYEMLTDERPHSFSPQYLSGKTAQNTKDLLRTARQGFFRPGAARLCQIS